MISICCMHVQLTFLILWPEREILRKTMPLCFRAVYGTKVVAIIDCYIAVEVTLMQASLHIPAFTKGLSQLSPVNVEKTRKLANLRIHIEQVIGATRQLFSILSSTLPIQYMKKSSPDDIPVVDKIVRICSALNNMCVSCTI